MSKYEWVTNMHRDTLASHVGHYDQLSYYAVAQNESIGRVKKEYIEKMSKRYGEDVKKILKGFKKILRRCQNIDKMSRRY